MQLVLSSCLSGVYRFVEEETVFFCSIHSEKNPGFGKPSVIFSSSSWLCPLNVACHIRVKRINFKSNQIKAHSCIAFCISSLPASQAHTGAVVVKCSELTLRSLA
jgi:hypothetical protein